MMPSLTPDTMYVIGLYNKCRANKSLPRSGGVLDQPAWIMEMFATIDETRGARAKAAREKAEDLDASRRKNGR